MFLLRLQVGWSGQRLARDTSQAGLSLSPRVESLAGVSSACLRAARLCLVCAASRRSHRRKQAGRRAGWRTSWHTYSQASPLGQTINGRPVDLSMIINSTPMVAQPAVGSAAARGPSSDWPAEVSCRLVGHKWRNSAWRRDGRGGGEERRGDWRRVGRPTGAPAPLVLIQSRPMEIKFAPVRTAAHLRAAGRTATRAAAVAAAATR